MENKKQIYCFAISPTTGELIQINRGEKGYTMIADPETGKKITGLEAKGIMQKQNKLLGLTDEQVKAMIEGSMFGWDCPAAQPAFTIVKDDVEVIDNDYRRSVELVWKDQKGYKVGFEYFKKIVDQYNKKGAAWPLHFYPGCDIFDINYTRPSGIISLNNGRNLYYTDDLASINGIYVRLFYVGNSLSFEEKEVIENYFTYRRDVVGFEFNRFDELKPLHLTERKENQNGKK